MRKLFTSPIFMVLTIILILSCCEEENPVPVLTSISPTSKVAHMPSFTLTLEGQKFVQGATVVFNGREKSSTFVSANQLTCQIGPADIVETTAIMGNQNYYPVSLTDASVQVTVRNPAPGGGSSDTLNFLIKSNHSFTTPTAIANISHINYQGDIGIGTNGNIYVTYYTPKGLSADLMYTKSSDGGTTWSVPVILSSDCVSWSDFTKIEIDNNGNVHVMWAGFEGNTVFVGHKYLNAATNNWIPTYKVCEFTSSTAYDYEIWGADMVVNDHEVFIVTSLAYFEHSGGYKNLNYFYHSDDSGVSFSEKQLTFMGNIARMLDLIMLNNATIALAYMEVKQSDDTEDIYFTKSSDKGSTWSTPVMISPSTDIGWSHYPKILSDSTGQNINAIWIHDFVENSKLSSINTIIPKYKYDSIVLNRPLIRALSVNSYYQNSGEKKVIYLSRSTDGGDTWSIPSTIYDFIYTDPYIFLGCEPVIDSAGNLDLIFQDRVSTPSLSDVSHSYFMRSIDNGATWSTRQELGSNPLDISAYNIAVNSAGDIFVLLEYLMSTSPTKWSVYLYLCKSIQ